MYESLITNTTKNINDSTEESHNESQNKIIENENTVEFKQFPPSKQVVFQTFEFNLPY